MIYEMAVIAVIFQTVIEDLKNIKELSIRKLLLKSKLLKMLELLSKKIKFKLSSRFISQF